MFVFDNYYTLSELVKTAYSMLTTKLLFPNASLIRRPIYVRGLPRIKVGKGFRTGYRCRLETFGDRADKKAKLTIGENCHIGDSVHIAASENVTIGDNCLFASHIFISDCSHGSYSGSVQDTPGADHPEKRELVSEPTSIGSNVWLGEGVSVLMGAHIGNGCIVGANSVVTKRFPDNCMLVGSPARIIKRYDDHRKQWLAV